MEAHKENKSFSIIGIIITIIVILFLVSWSYGITVKTNEYGEAECYNIYGKRVGC